MGFVVTRQCAAVSQVAETTVELLNRLSCRCEQVSWVACLCAVTHVDSYSERARATTSPIRASQGVGRVCRPVRHCLTNMGASNGLLRQYLPRHVSLRDFTQADLDGIAAELNGRPRQTLGFKTPSEALR